MGGVASGGIAVEGVVVTVAGGDNAGRDDAGGSAVCVDPAAGDVTKRGVVGGWDAAGGVTSEGLADTITACGDAVNGDVDDRGVPVEASTFSPIGLSEAAVTVVAKLLPEMFSKSSVSDTSSLVELLAITDESTSLVSWAEVTFVANEGDEESVPSTVCRNS